MNMKAKDLKEGIYVLFQGMPRKVKRIVHWGDDMIDLHLICSIHGKKEIRVATYRPNDEIEASKDKRKFLAEIKSRIFYNLYDHVYFKVRGNIYHYRVENCYLNNLDGINDIIFTALGIDHIFDFCSEVYGYIANPGIFPEWNVNDLEAPTKIINALNQKIQEINEA